MDITIISTGKHGPGIATRILAGGNREKHRGRPVAQEIDARVLARES
jgi:hypothetical protein